MDLKTYQKNVLGDLSRFLTLLTEKGSAAKAYTALWAEKNISVGYNGLSSYRYNLSSGVPDVCFKVPTGGGKTFIAANAVRLIYNAMPVSAAKAVVWLVPSDTILTQTYRTLSNPHHPYRSKLDVDFGGAVEVYSKQQLLNGQNFNPTSVAEQLSVFVLSYDSFRTGKKEGRKAYQENGNLASFPKYMKDKDILLPDTDETALIQVIRSLNPVVIVDESHHATSKLSVEMLENFNPCFVLDLTATPKERSNVISFVDAVQLKAENMVKLPVIVYNRKSQADVFADAVSVRCKLEAQAKADQEITGRYIRPIVLFQAQPRVGTENTTYDKIKKTLVEAGIPVEQIAIKTGDKDELKKVDLLAPDCPIRYIITVNALKEGWDCPFAYVLATVANRTSSVDVEQILGRILRLPDTEKNKSKVLNISYVITSSADFGKTLDNVVKGLNHAGFSDKDYRVGEADADLPQPAALPVRNLFYEPQEEELPEIDAHELRQRIETVQNRPVSPEDIETDDMLSAALAQNDAYEQRVGNIEDTAVNSAPAEVRNKMNVFRMNDEYEEEAKSLRFPQFMLKVSPGFFSDDKNVLLRKEHLEDGFSLKYKDPKIDFSAVDAELARVDIDDKPEAVPKVWQIKGTDSAYYKEWFNSQPSAVRLAHCKGLIKNQLSRINSIDDRELPDYIDRIVENMTADQLSDMEQSPYPYIEKIKSEVKSLLDAHRMEKFDLWLEQGKIECLPNYSLKSTVSPADYFSSFPKSLYTGEEDVNDYERKVIWRLSSMDNIKWWHRNISRLGFQINGAVHAYPDIIAMTTSGKILMIETKGDHLDNAESKIKAITGSKWASLSGNQFRYFMVFQSKSPGYPGAYSYDRFFEIAAEL